METENLSTAASRFALRFTTELVGDKESSPLVTLASASGARGSCDIGAPRGARNEQLHEASFMDVRPSSAPTVVLDDYVSAEDRTRSGLNTWMTAMTDLSLA